MNFTENTANIKIASLRGANQIDLGYTILNGQTLFNIGELRKAGSDILELHRIALNANPKANLQCIDFVDAANLFCVDDSDADRYSLRIKRGLEFEVTLKDAKDKDAYKIIECIASSLSEQAGPISVSRSNGVPYITCLDESLRIQGYLAPAIGISFRASNDLIQTNDFYKAANVLATELEKYKEKFKLSCGFGTDFTLDFVVQVMINQKGTFKLSGHNYKIGELQTYARIGRAMNDGIKPATVCFR